MLYGIAYILLGLFVGFIVGRNAQAKKEMHTVFDLGIDQTEVHFYSPEDIELKRKKRRDISWQTVAFAVNFIIKDIIRTRFEPDIVVGIGRGGGIIACLVAGNLGNKPVAIIDRKIHYNEGKVKSELSDIPQVVFKLKKVLLVMGGPSTGRVLLEVAQMVSEKIGTGAEIRTLNLFEKLPVKYNADFKYKSFKVEARPPWQLREEYKGFDARE